MRVFSAISLFLIAIFVPVAVLAFDAPSKEIVRLDDPTTVDNPATPQNEGINEMAISIDVYWRKFKEWNNLQFQAVIDDLSGLYAYIDGNSRAILREFGVSYSEWWETRNLVSKFITFIQTLLNKYGSVKEVTLDEDEKDKKSDPEKLLRKAVDNYFQEAFLEIQDLRAVLGTHPRRYAALEVLENDNLLRRLSASDPKIAARFSRIKENLAHKIKELENFRNLVWLFRMIERLEFNIKKPISQREASVDYDIEASGLYDAFQAWKNGDLRGELESLQKAQSYFQSTAGEIFEKTREDIDEKIRYLEGKIASLPQTPPAPPSIPPKDGAEPPRAPTGGGRGANVPTSHDGRAPIVGDFWTRVLTTLVERFMPRIITPIQPTQPTPTAPTTPTTPPATYPRTRAPAQLPAE